MQKVNLGPATGQLPLGISCADATRIALCMAEPNQSIVELMRLKSHLLGEGPHEPDCPSQTRRQEMLNSIDQILAG